MRKLTAIIILCFLSSYCTLSAQETEEKSKDSKTSSTEEYTKFRFGGYGEMAASYKDYNFNRFTPNGSGKLNRGEISIPRFVLAFDYKFSSKWVLSTEIEFEYGGTGAAREIEWFEENGEYETEIEKGGEVALEQFHITRLINKHINLRFGHMIVPVGLTNNHHEPINFFGVYRPEGETTILPSTWHETGIAVFGEIGRFDYELQLVNGLDPQGFRSEDWIKNGRQGAFEVNNFTSPAFVARVNYHGVKGLRVGASFYYNQTAKNGTKPWRNTGYKFPVTIVTGDLQYKGFNNNLIVRGNAVYGNLGASGALTTINNSSSAASGYPNTTVAQNAVSYGGEAGYNISSFFNSKAPRIYPFIRYEYYNPMEKTEANTGLLADKRFQVSAVTAGLNYYALPNLVIKADYTHRSIGGGKYNDENLVSVGIAYIGWFIKK
ncbi:MULTISPECIES: hypothetical protein [Bacteroides]|uniref:hypothetical protein n=1 Tax=Bacteroides TaxID=816 RepID=UPI00319DB8BF